MHRSLRGFLGAVAVLAIGAGTASAQSWKFEAGVNAGGAFRTASVKPTTGDNVRFGPGWLVGSQLGVRLLPQLRLRANGAFGPATTKLGSTQQWDRTELWALSGDLMYSFKKPADEFTTREVLPYIAAGAGARWVRPTGTLVGVLSHDTVFPGIVVGPATEQYLIEQEEVPMGLVALGTDIRTSRNMAFRLEAGDRIFKPKVDKLVGHYSIADKGNGTLTHEIYAIAGINLLFGMKKAPAVVTVAPPPPTPPQTPVAAPTPTPTPPPPPPPPPPAEQTVSVCVLDTTGAMRDVSATFLPATGDTVVTANGARVKIQDAFTAGPALSAEGWFQRGEPLVIGTGARGQKYVPFGTPRTFRPGEVVFVGRLNGMPVLADPTEAKPLVDALGAGRDLNKAAVRPVVRRQLNSVKTVYVPARAAGCVLQPLQQQEAVRKVRG